MKYIVFSILFVAGCASTSPIQVVKINSKSYPPKSKNCKIDVLTQKPDEAFEKITLLNAKQEINAFISMFKRPRTNAFSLLPDIKKKACLAGGDAIIIISFKDGEFIDAGYNGSSVQATLIKYSKSEKK